MWSNSANKFFDSLASATPVVINYGGWQADIINNSGCGIVVPSCNANEAAVMMYEKLSNKSWLESAAQNANKLAVNRFNRDVLAKEFESTLLDSLK